MEDLLKEMREALFILNRTGTGLESTLSQDLSGLTPREQQAIVANSRTNHKLALAIAKRALQRYADEVSK